jgi:hypothetical protein
LFFLRHICTPKFTIANKLEELDENLEFLSSVILNDNVNDDITNQFVTGNIVPFIKKVILQKKTVTAQGSSFCNQAGISYFRSTITARNLFLSNFGGPNPSIFQEMILFRFYRTMVQDVHLTVSPHKLTQC